MALSLNQRLANFEQLEQVFQDIDRACFDKSSKAELIDGQVNLHYYLNLVKEIGQGNFNTIYQAELADQSQPFALKENYREATDRRVGLACTADYYALLVTNLVKNNLWPNFLLTVNSFVCDWQRMPVTLMELAEHNLKEHYGLNRTSCAQLIVQTLLTVYFLNKSLGMAHGDMKPENVLVKSIEPTTITYQYQGNYLTLTTEVLALVIDFDLMTPLTEEYREEQLAYLDHYADYLTRKYLPFSQSIQRIVATTKEETEISIDVVQFMLMSLDDYSISMSQYQVLEFLETYLAQPNDFVACLQTYYGNYFALAPECPADSKLFNVEISVSLELNYAKYHHLYACLMLNPFFRQRNQETFLTEVFGLNRFTQSDQDLEQLIEHPPPNVLAEQPQITPAIRQQVYNWLVKLGKLPILRWSNDEIVSVLLMIDHYLAHRPNVPWSDIQTLAALALYLRQISQKLTLNFLLKHTHGATEEKINYLLDDLLRVLHQTR